MGFLCFCVSVSLWQKVPNQSRMYFRLKRLEQSWNRLFIRVLGRLIPVSPSEQPDWGARPHRVLYLRHDKIGDMIVSTSLIDAIAKSHPTITLDVLASPANAPVLEGNPNVASVIVWDKARPGGYSRLFRELRRAQYDAVIDCMILAPSTTALLLMLASGARHRIGIGGRINDYALTLRVPPATSAVHHIEHSAVLATAFGVKVADVDWRPRIYLSENEMRSAENQWNGTTAKRILINISAGRPMRRWPDQNFVALLHHLGETAPDANVLVISAPADCERASQIAKSRNARYAPTKALRDALALVATSDILVTPDTSIVHSASAFEIPAVILFEKGKEMLWSGYKIPGRNVVNDETTLSTLPIEPVLAAVDEVLQNTPSHFQRDSDENTDHFSRIDNHGTAAGSGSRD